MVGLLVVTRDKSSICQDRVKGTCLGTGWAQNDLTDHRCRRRCCTGPTWSRCTGPRSPSRHSCSILHRASSIRFHHTCGSASTGVSFVGYGVFLAETENLVRNTEKALDGKDDIGKDDDGKDDNMWCKQNSLNSTTILSLTGHS